jgi:hypothetical protein
MVRGGDYAMNAAVEPIDGGKATLAELRRVGIDALAKALGPVGMARFHAGRPMEVDAHAVAIRREN